MLSKKWKTTINSKSNRISTGHTTTASKSKIKDIDYRMALLKSNYNVIATIFFVLFIIFAHLFATNHYDFTKNTISDLGAQGYSRKIIMQTGFLTFGLLLCTGIILNGLNWRTTPLLIYGLCVALTGIFCTKPFFQHDTYSTAQTTLHSLFAQVAGISFSIGILMQIFFLADKNLKLIHLFFSFL